MLGRYVALCVFLDQSTTLLYLENGYFCNIVLIVVMVCIEHLLRKLHCQFFCFTWNLHAFFIGDIFIHEHMNMVFPMWHTWFLLCDICDTCKKPNLFMLQMVTLSCNKHRNLLAIMASKTMKNAGESVKFCTILSSTFSVRWEKLSLISVSR